MLTRDMLDRLTDDLLAALAADPDLLAQLVAETGLVPADLRALAGAGTLDLSTALVDFICAGDARLTAFSATSGWPVDRVAMARAALEAGQIR